MSQSFRCMKCKNPKKTSVSEYVVSSRGGVMARGKCPDCGTNMCTILKAINAPADIQAKVAKIKAANAKTKVAKTKGTKTKTK